MKMKKSLKSRKGGSVIFAIVMAMLSLMITSVLWFILYPIVEAVADIVVVTNYANAALFADLLINVWVWLGVIMLVNVLMWAFAYTVKRDWESQIQ